MSSANSTGFKTVETFTISLIYKIKSSGYIYIYINLYPAVLEVYIYIYINLYPAVLEVYPERMILLMYGENTLINYSIVYRMMM